MARETEIIMEVERVMNLVRGFGWEKVREETRDNDVYITVKKTLPGASVTPGTPGPG